MQQRKIITIDRDKCDGCSNCIPNCPEGAIQIIDGKACLVSDLFCDGLGACLGHCPQGAISIQERPAEPYDELKVMANIVKQGQNVIRAHLLHLKAHSQTEYFHQALRFLMDNGTPIPVLEKDIADENGCAGRCPGQKVLSFAPESFQQEEASASAKRPSQLRQWPVQLALVPAQAAYLNGADILIAADCLPFAYASFHDDLLKGKILLVGCPKLDDLEAYRKKISAILSINDVRSITYAHMEVPCCFGLKPVIMDAIKSSSRRLPFIDITVSVRGEKIAEERIDV